MVSKKQEILWIERLVSDDTAHQKHQNLIYQRMLEKCPDMEAIGEKQSQKALQEWGLKLDYVAPTLRKDARQEFKKKMRLGS